LAFGTSILPYFVLVGFLGGLSLAAYGLIGWGRRQKVTDALEDLALTRGQVELRQMTAQEQVEELNREAEESAADIAQARAPEAEQVPAGTRSELVSDIRNRAMILEASLADKLRVALGQDGVQTNIRASSPTGRVYVDALARVGSRTIVFELKYLASFAAGLSRVRDALMQLDHGVRAVIESGVSDVSGVAIFVLPDEAGDEDIKRIVTRANQAESSLKLAHRTLVMRYSDFLSLSPDDLVSRLSADSGPHKAA
jgi:hypothetical protein